jgi:hypothetical protein
MMEIMVVSPGPNSKCCWTKVVGILRLATELNRSKAGFLTLKGPIIVEVSSPETSTFQWPAFSGYLQSGCSDWATGGGSLIKLSHSVQKTSDSSYYAAYEVDHPKADFFNARNYRRSQLNFYIY